MKLPEEFLNKMKALLGEKEFEEFLESYKLPRYYGLRVNTLKCSAEDFLKIPPFNLERVPWTKDGFYYEEGAGPGKHPYYHAGLYYIQEPSAMLPGAVLGAQPGDKVLDLCAAPGGKTVQIGADLKGEGLLVSNDISSDRVKALVKNIELCGIKNAVVTNETPEKLATVFKDYFDRILVDAPCSGEGMFRKDEDAARSWMNFKCEKCASMQRDILESVDEMLKEGGTLVYSTCTFSPEEDERMIVEFMGKHPYYIIEEIPKIGGIDFGRPEWSNGSENLKKAARLWPHKLKGEGHFVAKLRKMGKGNMNSGSIPFDITWKREKPKELVDFEEQNLNIKLNGYFSMKGRNLYSLPCEIPELRGIKVAKFGWYLGEIEHGRLDPSHSLAISLKMEDFKRSISFESTSREIISYLKGETLIVEGEKGITAVCVDGYVAGLAKQTGDMLKNLYPKGWRKMN